MISPAVSPPRLDGQWHLPPWTDVPALAVSAFHPKSSDHRPVTGAKLLYDSDNLHVSFRVEDRYV
ncbi:MAG: hypothetical protein MK171_09420 [Pirellulales bacterium]|nr:hypothetical protein [Pirellulales bacterium]